MSHVEFWPLSPVEQRLEAGGEKGVWSLYWHGNIRFLSILLKDTAVEDNTQAGALTVGLEVLFQTVRLCILRNLLPFGTNPLQIKGVWE